MKYILIFLFSINVLYAQDLIYLKNEPVPVNVKIIEVNSTEIKYKLPSDSFPVMAYLRLEVDRVVLANGVVLEIANKGELSRNIRLGSIKYGLLSPLFNHVNFSYEQYIGKNKSWEITGGITGLSRTFGENRSVGGYVKSGFKWMSPKTLNPNFEQRKFLSGLYLKPELSLGMFTDYNYYRYNRDRGYKDEFYGSVLFNMGYQVVSLNGMTLDISAGLGYYGLSSNYSDEFYYAFYALGDDVPIAISFGVRIGYTFIREKQDHTSK